MNTARRLAEQIRAVLPVSRDVGRVRRKGDEPADIDTLQSLQVRLALQTLQSARDVLKLCHDVSLQRALFFPVSLTELS